jgi:hypothetical protein
MQKASPALMNAPGLDVATDKASPALFSFSWGVS